jgi:quercetin dioxygenase-like cupin family protein
MTPDLSGDLEVLEMRLPPGGISADGPMGHPGEECMVVIKGQAELELDGEIHVLGPGDSATYFAQVPHRIRNVGRGELIAISAITPPSF